MLMIITETACGTEMNGSEYMRNIDVQSSVPEVLAKVWHCCAVNSVADVYRVAAHAKDIRAVWIGIWLVAVKWTHPMEPARLGSSAGCQTL